MDGKKKFGIFLTPPKQKLSLKEICTPSRALKKLMFVKGLLKNVRGNFSR